MAPTTPWSLNDDRVFSPDPVARAAAREIFAATRNLPLVSMHGHVDAQLLADNQPFPDPAELFIIPDHYLVRMLVSQGIDQADMGVRPVDGSPVKDVDHRAVWRRFCDNWHLFRGTPTRYWLEYEFAEVFHLSGPPTSARADALYDELQVKLTQPKFAPRALFESFGLELMSTTDDATSDLAYHAKLATDGWGERVVPTFRPDALMRITDPAWPGYLAKLGALVGNAIATIDDFVSAIAARRQVFVAAGARASDHGHRLPDTHPLEGAAAKEIFDAALRGQATVEQQDAFGAHMLFQMAAMACDDGLVMQIHPGVERDYDPAVLARYGRDKGYDIPFTTEYTRALRPLLETYGHHPGFRVIVFTVDETAFSRELGPLAGVFPAMKLGAPWWFLDSIGGMERFRGAVTETAGFYNMSGFVDDTRAFASIPARHDLARRVDAKYLADLVTRHLLTIDEATQTAIDLAYNLPKAAYPKPKPANHQ